MFPDFSTFDEFTLILKEASIGDFVEIFLSQLYNKLYNDE